MCREYTHKKSKPTLIKLMFLVILLFHQVLRQVVLCCTTSSLASDTVPISAPLRPQRQIKIFITIIHLHVSHSASLYPLRVSMAEAIGLASSLLAIAAFGASVVTTLRTFAASYSRAEQRVNELSFSVALTASILTELGYTIKQYEAEFHITAHNFMSAKTACENNFNKLSKALKSAKVNEGSSNGDKGKGKGKALGAWEKLMFALGGEDELKELIVSIETSKSTLQLLLESVKLVILRKLYILLLFSAELQVFET